MAVIDTDVLVRNVTAKQSEIASLEGQAQPLRENINQARRAAQAAMSSVKSDIDRLQQLNRSIASLKKELAVDARKLRVLDIKAL